MYIIGFAVLAILVFYASTILFDGIFYFSRTGNKYFEIGNPWFYGLLIINLIILVFIYQFYQYKASVGSAGDTGLGGFPGKKGRKGQEAYLSRC